MCRFLESIKLKDGVFFRLKYHQERVNHCFQLFFPGRGVPDLSSFLQQQDVPKAGLFKCRILYDEQGFIQPEIMPYQMRTVKSLKLVDTSLEAMAYKSTDRSVYEQLFAQRGDCDDVILVRNGLLTDTSFANIALFDGKQWVTPRLPVLYGTNRSYLLEKGLIVEKDIKAENLHLYQKIRLFNALIEFGEVEVILNLSGF
ncbi:MAG: aminotransferase class IV [Paludibacter sp.]|nr:aminotransferase class IV [Paludibacter sp.]MDD4198340.1 aminotransferase class IV [Paludibacter sp.]MDD4428081.1 aminotransferase class IV [Paludibacter sp.]